MRGNHKIGVAGMHDDIAHGNLRKIRTMVLRPLLAAIERNPKSEFGAKEQQIGGNSVFLNYVRKTTDSTFGADDRGPGFSVVCGFEYVWIHIAESVAVE